VSAAGAWHPIKSKPIKSSKSHIAPAWVKQIWNHAMPCRRNHSCGSGTAAGCCIYTVKDGLDPEDVKVLKTFPILCVSIYSNIFLIRLFLASDALWV